MARRRCVPFVVVHSVLTFVSRPIFSTFDIIDLMLSAAPTPSPLFLSLLGWAVGWTRPPRSASWPNESSSATTMPSETSGSSLSRRQASSTTSQIARSVSRVLVLPAPLVHESQGHRACTAGVLLSCTNRALLVFTVNYDSRSSAALVVRPSLSHALCCRGICRLRL